MKTLMSNSGEEQAGLTVWNFTEEKMKGCLPVCQLYVVKSDIQDTRNHLGRRFPSSHDRRHNLSVNASFEVNDRITLGSNFVYSTGRPFTLPVGRYEIENYNLNFYTGRNQYRLPDYHRLDLSATIRPREKYWGKSTIQAGLSPSTTHTIERIHLPSTQENVRMEMVISLGMAPNLKQAGLTSSLFCHR